MTPAMSSPNPSQVKGRPWSRVWPWPGSSMAMTDEPVGSGAGASTGRMTSSISTF